MGILGDKFIVPPFSVLDTKQKYWQERKRQWLNMGIKSEIGRGDNLCFGDFNTEKFSVPIKKNYGKCLPKGFDEEKYGVKQSQATSIFDPVLCEIMYKWFVPKKGNILDPFAGGSVRGIVATKEGYSYTGLELSDIQVKANIEQSKTMGLNPIYIQGDSDKILDTLDEWCYDFIFSCPPYADLEIYSEHIDDLSNKPYNIFLKKYNTIIKKSIEKLKPNRFAVFVVGDVRDDKGMYRCFVEDTVKCFTENGMKKYNEIILLNAIGSLPIRTSAQFKGMRKVGKCHQNVLVFFKGDTTQIEKIFGVLNLEDAHTKSLDDF